MHNRKPPTVTRNDVHAFPRCVQVSTLSSKALTGRPPVPPVQEPLDFGPNTKRARPCERPVEAFNLTSPGVMALQGDGPHTAIMIEVCSVRRWLLSNGLCSGRVCSAFGRITPNLPKCRSPDSDKTNGRSRQLEFSAFAGLHEDPYKKHCGEDLPTQSHFLYATEKLSQCHRAV